jgi:hypothetical protein
VVKNFFSYINEDRSSPYYDDELCPKFWTLKKVKGEETWILDPVVSKKLSSIAKDFIEESSSVLKKKDILDIQLVGSLTGYNWNQYSDLDLHIIVDYSDMGEDKEMVDQAMWGLKFHWNTKHDIIMRGHDVEIAVQDVNSESYMSTVYSLEKKKWIKAPKYDPPKVDDFMVNKKFGEYAYLIEKLENKLVISNTFPAKPKPLYNMASKLKSKIMKMRKESLAKGGEFSVGNIVFKKLRSQGYIAKLMDIITKSYDKIYNL